MESSYFQPILRYSLSHRAAIQKLFTSVSWIIAGILIVSIVMFDPYNPSLFGLLASFLGFAALLLFITTLLPGIFRRLRYVHPIIQSIMLFRRQFGILMFLSALFHGMCNSILPAVFTNQFSLTSISTFEIAGVITVFVLLLPLALTSNDWSVSHMGKWWKRVHMLSYVAAFTLFGHLFLIEAFSFWSILIGLTIAAEIYSFIHVWVVAKTQ